VVYCRTVHCFLNIWSIKERTQTSADMGNGRHVVIHGVIHDDNEIGNRMATDQSAIRTNFHA